MLGPGNRGQGTVMRKTCVMANNGDLAAAGLL